MQEGRNHCKHIVGKVSLVLRPRLLKSLISSPLEYKLFFKLPLLYLCVPFMQCKKVVLYFLFLPILILILYFLFLDAICHRCAVVVVSPRLVCLSSDFLLVWFFVVSIGRHPFAASSVFAVVLGVIGNQNWVGIVSGFVSFLFPFTFCFLFVFLPLFRIIWFMVKDTTLHGVGQWHVCLCVYVRTCAYRWGYTEQEGSNRVVTILSHLNCY